MLINLQDKTSWRDTARCTALEGVQKNVEFNKSSRSFLAKDTPFYYQIKEYASKSNAAEFIATLVHNNNLPHLKPFIDSITKAIHKHFFGKNDTLNRREREDFIEIFYLFLSLKVLDLASPNTASFTCKDGVDTGAAQTAAFYAFLKLLKSEFTTKPELDYFRWLLYAPALFVRERAIDQERLNRMLSALEALDHALSENRTSFHKDIDKLYTQGLFKTLKVR